MLIAVVLAAAHFDASWRLDAAAIHGELKKDAIAWGIVILLGLLIWVGQEWGLRRALGMAGVATFVAGAMIGVGLISLGLL